jgi:hypothetical protein
VKHTAESESDSASESPGPNTNYGRRTKKKVTAGEGLQDVAGAMRSAMTELADAFSSAPGSDSPSRQGLALAAIEKHEDLDDEDMDIALELMMNSKLVSTYLNITSRSTRSRFLRKHIHLFRVAHTPAAAS